jgi:hypothetical protein
MTIEVDALRFGLARDAEYEAFALVAIVRLGNGVEALAEVSELRLHGWRLEEALLLHEICGFAQHISAAGPGSMEHTERFCALFKTAKQTDIDVLQLLMSHAGDAGRELFLPIMHTSPALAWHCLRHEPILLQLAAWESTLLIDPHQLKQTSDHSDRVLAVKSVSDRLVANQATRKEVFFL